MRHLSRMGLDCRIAALATHLWGALVARSFQRGTRGERGASRRKPDIASAIESAQHDFGASFGHQGIGLASQAKNLPLASQRKPSMTLSS